MSEIPSPLGPQPVSEIDTPLPGPNKSNNHAARGKKAARKRKRQESKAKDAVDYKVPRRAGKMHTASAGPIPSDLHTEGLPAASTGFVGKNEDEEEKQQEHVCLEDLYPIEGGSDFRLVKFDGL